MIIEVLNISSEPLFTAKIFHPKKIRRRHYEKAGES